MSIFGDILRKIFPSHHPAVTGAPAPSTAPGATATAAPTPAAGAAPGSAASSARTAPPVDVEAVLSALAQKNPQKLNWQTSIVDLMKLLDLDSSLANRQSLAKELGYTGDMHDSATMNIWLQKQVMQKLGENGGKVPEALKH
ncbi:DUF3597 domain-containing protein [Ideonella sp. YS5]|uniref:DUF3597 domain-containing protein n=1 Tax=Ideonella sp. YS5 TaxID=3453714 RepID=UPI003EEC3B26